MVRITPSVESGAAFKARLALRRYGHRREVADATAWLVSGSARFMTGTILRIDGGTALGDASGSALVLDGG